MIRIIMKKKIIKYLEINKKKNLYDNKGGYIHK